MSRFPGNIIKLPNVTPTQSSASGVWSLRDQIVAQRNNLWPFQPDPYFNYTTLLLQGNVPNTTGPQAMTQPLAYNSDASTNNFLVTPNGDVSPRPFSPYFGGNYSNYFDGSGDYLNVATNAAFNFGTGDATVEFWFNAVGAQPGNYPGIVSSSDYNTSGSASIRYSNTGYSQKIFMYLNGGGDPVIASASTVAYGIWTHVAIVRQGTSLKIYLNGTQDASVTISASLGFNLGYGELRVGRGFDVDGAGGYFNGYLSNLRLVKGTAVYTTNFTPPTQPLQNITGTSLLTCQSNRFIDNSTANSGSGFTITRNGDVRVTDNSPFVSTDSTTGAGYFDGNGDYLSLATGIPIPSSGTFTIEAWVFPTDVTDETIWTQYSAGTSGRSSFRIVSGKLTFANSSASTATSVASVLTNTWTHVAVVRDSSNNLLLFINGALDTTVSSYTASIQQIAATIGAFSDASSAFTGYISSLRTTSTAVYTSTFTPPTAPLTPITNTSLLTLQTRAASQNIGFIDSSPNEFIVTKNGNTTQGTFSPFSPTGWSNNFNGANNLSVAQTTALDLGSGNFTVEAWIYPLNYSGNQRIIAKQRSSDGYGWIFRINSSNGYLFLEVDTGGVVTSSSAPSLNTWSHVAAVRSGNSVSLYLNGNLVGSNSSYSGSPTSVSASAYVGSSAGGEYFSGLISNIRFTKGQAFATGAFTPPTELLSSTVVGWTGTNVPTQSITGAVGILTCQSNRFKDNSPNNFTLTPTSTLSVQAFSPFAPATQSSPLVTGGSGYFDASGDSLTIPSASALNMTGDFCMEGWAYPTAASITFAWKYVGGNVGASEYWFTIDGVNRLSLALDGGGGEDYFRTAENTITLNAWNHCVATRVGTAVRMFINGVLQSYNTTSRTLNVTSTTFMTSGQSGYISSLRIVKGAVPDLYQTSVTSTGVTIFTPPTAPPTAIPNTSLLLNFTGGGIVDATGKNNLETVANAQVSTVQAKWPPGSMAFNGASGTYLNVAVTTVPLGSGDFVVEGWVYLNASKAQGIFDTRTTNTSTTGIALYLTSGNAWQMVLNNAGVNFGGSITNSVWTHVAVVRTGSTVYLYVAGSLVNSSALSNNLTDTTFLLGTLRDNADATTTWKLNGYVDDFRITKGYNRGYSGASITVPTGPFPIG